jgi:hypothetical protein
MSDEEKKDAAVTSGTDGTQTGATSGTGNGKDGAGNDGDLSKESPAELARIIADLRKKTRRPARSSASWNRLRRSGRRHKRKQTRNA